MFEENIVKFYMAELIIAIGIFIIWILENLH